MIFGREPVLLTTLLGAVVNLAVVFGVPMNEAQIAGVNTLIFAAVGFAARRKVTPSDS